MPIKNKDEFFELIQHAGETNSVVSENTKVLKEMKNDLKTYMIDNGIEKAESSDFTLSAYETNKRSMDEVKLMEIIKQLIEECDNEEDAENLASCIEYRPQINEEIVENLVYNQILPEDKLAEALITKTSVAIRFGKVKKEKTK